MKSFVKTIFPDEKNGLKNTHIFALLSKNGKFPSLKEKGGNYDRCQ